LHCTTSARLWRMDGGMVEHDWLQEAGRDRSVAYVCLSFLGGSSHKA
jgi:hypothetical protein